MKKENIGILLSILAFVGVISVWGLWICNVIEFSVVSLDSFVGVMVAILGLLITFAIGWQIINVLELKSKIEDVEQLEPKLEKFEKQLTGAVSTSKAEIAHMLALQAITIKDYVLAFRYYHQSLMASILAPTEYAIYVSSNITQLKNMLSSIKHSSTASQETWNTINNDDKEIRKAPNFKLIEDQYNTIMSEFHNKVKCEQ